MSPRIVLFTFRPQGVRFPVSVIFWTDPRVDQTEVSEAIREFSEAESPVSNLLVLTTAASEKTLEVLLQSPEIFRLPSDGQLSHAIFREDLSWHAPDEKTRNVLEGAMLAGFQAIFKRRNGVLVASDGFHYEKPSRHHSKKFLRAANVLIDSTETAFFAIEIARRVGLAELKDVKHVYTDTSAINSVALSLSHILRDFKISVEPFTVTSFGSYDGLKAGFQFYDVKHGLCLMSATTSGNLERELINKYGFDASLVVTLFAANPVPGNVLFNVSDISEEPFGSIENQVEGKCKFCDKGEQLIRISGDQFLPESPRMMDFTFTNKSLPARAAKLINDTVEKNVTACNVWDGRKRVSVTFLLFRNESPSPAESEVLQRLNRMLPHKASKMLISEGLFPKLDDYLKTELPTIQVTQSADELKSEPAKFVFCPLTYGGGEATSVALRLRSSESPHQRSFLLGISIFEDDEQLKEFSSNIRYGRYPDDYHADMPYTIQLPDVYGARKTPWQIETEFWDSIVDAMPESVGDAIRDRIGLISTGESGLDTGLRTKVFLPSVTGEDLEVSPGFAYWQNKAARGSQADVFLTISAILRHHRNQNPASKNDQSLFVMHPSMFFRFSDSAIQAAFLRALNSSELNYASSQEHSDFFARVFEFTLERFDKPEGFAASEFCYALFANKVWLVRSAMIRCLEACTNFLKDADTPWSRVFILLAERQLIKLN